MKSVLTVLIIISLNTILFAQTNQQAKPNAQENTVTQRQTVHLSLAKRSFRPKLTLQDALKIAESYIESRKIDISPYYLYQAKYILWGAKDNQEPCWHFWWVHENGAAGNYVEIVVSIDTAKARRVPSM